MTRMKSAGLPWRIESRDHWRISTWHWGWGEAGLMWRQIAWPITWNARWCFSRSKTWPRWWFWWDTRFSTRLVEFWWAVGYRWPQWWHFRRRLRRDHRWKNAWFSWWTFRRITWWLKRRGHRWTYRWVSGRIYGRYIWRGKCRNDGWQKWRRGSRDSSGMRSWLHRWAACGKNRGFKRWWLGRLNRWSFSWNWSRYICW